MEASLERYRALREVVKMQQGYKRGVYINLLQAGFRMSHYETTVDDVALVLSKALSIRDYVG